MWSSTDRFLFIRSLKSVCSSSYFLFWESFPSTSFVRPTIPSLLVTSSLKSDPINSIHLRHNLPLSVAPHSMGPSLDTPDGHMGWQPQLVLGNRALIDKVVASHKCYGTHIWIKAPLRLLLRFLYLYVAFHFHFYSLQPFPSVSVPPSFARI